MENVKLCGASLS